MGDLGDYWRDVKPILKREAQKHRDDAWKICEAQEDEARTLAGQHGFQIKSAGEQYNIKSPKGWIIQFYPGNGRIYRSGKGRAPKLRLNSNPIVLLDVVRACIEAEGIENMPWPKEKQA